MKNKLLILMGIVFCFGIATIYIYNYEAVMPVGAIEISNKVNGKYLAIEELTFWDKISSRYNSLFIGQGSFVENDNAGFVISGENNLKKYCWLPILQHDETTAFQYVCAGKYHNYYLNIQDNVASNGYLRLVLRQKLPSGFNWNVNPKEDGTFTYGNSGERFKGYYVAIKDDGIAKLYFGDIGPNARWYQNAQQTTQGGSN
jgi:hypothetical protein